MEDTPVSITAVLLTYNEEVNLPSCLDSLAGWCPKIFVIDSGSTDQTVELARKRGAEVIIHPFETHAKQWGWG